VPTSVPTPSLEIRNLDERTIVRIIGCDSLNEYNSHEVGQQLAGLIEQRALRVLDLDLSGIRYATSTILGKFVGLNRALRSAGGQLVLFNVGPAVAEAIAVTRLDRILDVRPLAEDGPECLSA
jgi:anti-anti-sigma factor